MATERKNTQTRKEEALIVAMTIIHKEGVHNLTLRRVAEGLGISEAALFRHFKDKENLIDLLASKVFEQYMVQEPEDSEDVEAGLLAMMTAQFSSFQGAPEATSVLFQEELFRGVTLRSRSALTRGGIREQTGLPEWSGMHRQSVR